jgi:cytochrome c
MRTPTALIAAAFVVTGAVISAPAQAAPADDIVAKEKCSRCHTATTTKKGPSWGSIATKYQGNAEAPAKLLAYLKTGGKMSDGEEHNKVVASDTDLKAVVAMVLAAK